MLNFHLKLANQIGCIIIIITKSRISDDDYAFSEISSKEIKEIV